MFKVRYKYENCSLYFILFQKGRNSLFPIFKPFTVNETLIYTNSLDCLLLLCIKYNDKIYIFYYLAKTNGCLLFLVQKHIVLNKSLLIKLH